MRRKIIISNLNLPISYSQKFVIRCFTLPRSHGQMSRVDFPREKCSTRDSKNLEFFRDFRQSLFSSVCWRERPISKSLPVLHFGDLVPVAVVDRRLRCRVVGPVRNCCRYRNEIQVRMNCCCRSTSSCRERVDVNCLRLVVVVVAAKVRFLVVVVAAVVESLRAKVDPHLGQRARELAGQLIRRGLGQTFECRQDRVPRPNRQGTEGA